MSIRSTHHAHIEQPTAEIAARICATTPVAAVLAAATGIAAVFVARRHRHHH